MNNPLTRLMFDKAFADANMFSEKSAKLLLTMYTEMLEPEPDLSKLHVITNDLAANIKQAENSFRTMMATNPLNTSGLRLYANFCTCINELEKSNIALADADRLEASKNEEGHATRIAKAKKLSLKF